VEIVARNICDKIVTFADPPTSKKYLAVRRDRKNQIPDGAAGPLHQGVPIPNPTI
jgi:hypothetical protein